MNKTSYIVAGPTASGKSDFAHQLALRIGGVIINCDSVQMYAGIENISASPFANRALTGDIDGVPYKLFSILPLAEQISVADYLELARAELSAAHAGGHPAIFVGGTGFYINALLHGISPIPDISQVNRARAREIVKNNPQNAMELLNIEHTTIHAFDPQRMSRALEVFLETGRPLAEWQALPRRGAVAPDAFKILINPHKEILSVRIAKRIPEMMAGGAMGEAHAVIAAGWEKERAIGASELVKFIQGVISEKECMQNWETRTVQYAKRQRTWFRNQYVADIEIPHVPTEKDIDNVPA
ncbi:MAG: tRNA (adenosine(37)-N6)-dimethylallyltransferase MiaA [Rickettsiales bacterium]|jgi:tRNA dimethylallyltransferase|nr:tRNA (adenosine(37)-N6)-dimethylallyltransferase MiaA [Rickettsiales bacterium]